MRMIYEKCLNCKETIDFATEDSEELDTYYRLSFCCEKCQKSYYENIILRSIIIKTDLGIDIPINSRFEILDLR